VTQRVAFLGPAGTFTEEALRASTRGTVEELPFPTVYETVMAVHDGRADRGIVPIENSLEGSVAATLDTLATEASDVRIVAEVVHPIQQCLIASGALKLAEVRRVLSHPQATAQCARFLRDQLAGAELASVTSTAEAVRLVAESPEPWAAIGSRLSAELYDCELLAEGIDDSAQNVTRFVWIAPATDPVAAAGTASGGEGALKTSVVFWGFNDDSPGALVAVLSEFSERGINLTKIESRPHRARLGHYMFFADLAGGEADPAVGEALSALGERVDTLRILGSYSAA
jgi:prephenate dehydratase